MPRLTKIFCAKCGRKLAETLPGTDVFCPNCRRWTIFKNYVPPKKASTGKRP